MNWSYLRDILEDTWLLQGLAVLGSILLTGVLVALLVRFDNTPVLEWNKISLNAVVALTATILKGLIALTTSDCIGQAKWIWLSRQQRSLNDFAIIDQGSRGPLGSIRMLWQPMARSFISFGAILVILVVPMDSFVQLAVGKTNAIIYKNDSSTQISYARRYSKGNFNFNGAISVYISSFRRTRQPKSQRDFYYNVSITDTESTAKADSTMISAVLFDLTQPDTRVARQTVYNCPSGNCTWDTFQSLAVCSGCTDLTDRLKRSSFRPLAHDTTSAYFNETVYWLPNGLGLINANGVKIDQTLFTTGFGTGNKSQSMTFGSKDTLIWSMTLIRVVDPKVLWPHSSVTATECGLWYCVQSYKSMVKNNNLIEVSSPALSTRSRDSWQLSLDSFESPGYEGRVQDKLLNSTMRPPDSLNFDQGSMVGYLTDLQLGAGFNVSQAAVYGISDLMNTTFTGNVNAAVYGIIDPDNTMEANYTLRHQYNPARGDAFWCYNVANAYVAESDDIEYSPIAMQNLHYSQDLNVTFATLAKSMTNSIGENSDDNLVMTGQAGTLHVVYQIRWKYLILPIFLVFANAIFLIIVIFHTRKSGLAVLCSNAIPTLGFGGNIGPIFKKIRLRSRMIETAKHRQIHFISIPKKRPSGDAEDVTSSHEPDGATPPIDGDTLSLLQETDGHEMMTFVEDHLEDQDSQSRRRSDTVRSIISTITPDSRRA